jgi:hypothetical protein
MNKTTHRVSTTITASGIWEWSRGPWSAWDTSRRNYIFGLFTSRRNMLSCQWVMDALDYVRAWSKEISRHGQKVGELGQWWTTKPFQLFFIPAILTKHQRRPSGALSDMSSVCSSIPYLCVQLKLRSDEQS